MRKINLTVSIISLILFVCSHLYAQGGQTWRKAQELEKLGEYLEAGEMYEKFVLEEKKSKDKVKSHLVKGLNQAGYCFYQGGQYKKAAKKLEKALSIARKLKQKEIAASCLNRIGDFYKFIGRHDVAIKYYKDALGIFREQEQEDKVATILNYIGNTYNSWGQYDTAIEYLKEALAIDKKLSREDKVAADLESIGRVYETRGRYNKAIGYYEKALSTDRKLGQEERISVGLHNIGNIYKAWEQYDTSIKYYEESLDIYRKLWKEDNLVFSHGLTEIGDIYMTAGQYERAIKYYRDALDIYRNLSESDNVVTTLNSIGNVYELQGQYKSAAKYYEDALDTSRKMELEDKTAICLNNVGNIYDTLGQYDSAIDYYEKALNIDRKLGEDALKDMDSKNLDMVYSFYWSKHDKIIYPYEQALAINKKFEKDSDISEDLNRIGKVYVSKEKYKTAIKYFTESLTIVEELLEQTDALSIIEKLHKLTIGDVRKRFFYDQLHSYKLLAPAYIKDNNFKSAIEVIELSKAKLFIERFAISVKTKNRQVKMIMLQELDKIQKTLDDDTAIIIYANVDLENIVQIAITRKEVTGKEVSRKSFVQSSIDKYGTQINTLLINQRGLSYSKPDFDNIINYYGSLLKEVPFHGERGRRLSGGPGIDVLIDLRVVSPLISKPKIPDSVFSDNLLGINNIMGNCYKLKATNAREIGKVLYDLLIKPMDNQVKDKKNLILVPSGILSFVPFETLIDGNGQYLVENHCISYFQSLDIRKMVMGRKYREERKPLLAFGGAIYEETVSKANMIENKVQMAIFKKNVYSQLENVQQELVMKWLYPDYENLRSVRDVYNVLGVATWPNIPNTLSEVNNIKNVINKSNIFTGTNVTEKDVKELSDNWTFYNYNALHFATHGLVVQEVPELSALVLSQFEKDMGKEDGYLRTEEIAQMKIQADLVNLSAFEAGLGGIYETEGLTALIQSFILSGANAVSVSLWRVADESTSRFMGTMYSLSQDKGLSYPEAITEVKRRFINGDFGGKYSAPYYWAPFVYYGN
ncbi:MAG: CHAT domain-containing protein [Planctomycetota bacterium]|jgi:tetratricopeptide (TPR) repeat protein